jgi:hypothetical protein
MRAVLLLAMATLLAACGEKPQGTNAAVRKADSHAFQGTDNGYVATGWKAGDKASWEEQMRARARGQNEHVRIGGK